MSLGSDTSVVLINVFPHTLVCGSGQCWKGGRRGGCTWWQISHGVSNLLRKYGSRCEEPACHVAATHVCEAGHRLCCAHCGMFGVKHQRLQDSCLCVVGTCADTDELLVRMFRVPSDMRFRFDLIWASWDVRLTLRYWTQEHDDDDETFANEVHFMGEESWFDIWCIRPGEIRALVPKSIRFYQERLSFIAFFYAPIYRRACVRHAKFSADALPFYVDGLMDEHPMEATNWTFCEEDHGLEPLCPMEEEEEEVHAAYLDELAEELEREEKRRKV